MAWDPIGGADDEYSGDVPTDAFGKALGLVASLWKAQARRLPTTAELTEIFGEALTAAGHDAADVSSRLADLLAGPAAGSARKKPSPLRAGHVLRIPYGADGTRAAYGRILHAPRKGERAPGLGICVVVLDRDVLPGDDLATVPDAPWLLGPLHPGEELIKQGVWQVLGEVPLRGRELLLPTFQARLSNPQMTRSWMVITDYAGKEIEDTPGHRSRLVEQSVGAAASVVRTLRAVRGLERLWPAMSTQLTREDYGQ